MNAFTSTLQHAFGSERVAIEARLAPLTTFRVGGPAEWLLETRSSDELVRAVRLAAHAAVRIAILGGGSNVLVSDLGVRGLVIRPRAGSIVRVDDCRVRADAGVTPQSVGLGILRHAFT